ncbi:MAG: alpha/beta fold hydrolase [Acidimicrobiia bacterium]
MALSETRTVDTSLGKVSFGDSGAGPTRMVLHSLLTDRTAFDDVIEPLGGRFVTVDLPGFGASEPAGPDIDEYAHRVGALIESMELAADDLTLIGNGLGGFVALGTAIHHGDLFDRLLLVGCGAGFPESAKGAFTAMIDMVSSGGMEAVIPIAVRRIFTEDYLATHPQMVEARADVLRKTDLVAFVTACTALQSLDYTVLAPTVSNPTMIVVGEDDEATPPLLADDLHRLIPGSNLVRLPGVAHAPQIQDPDGFVNTTRQFLEGR